jgi:hypothetical protein
MKLKTVLNPYFQQTFSQFKEEKLPTFVSYQLAKITKKITDEFKHYNDARMEAVKQYATKDEKGEPAIKDNEYVFSDDESKKKFFDELAVLGEQEFETNKISAKKLIETGGELKAVYFEVLEDIFSDDV